MIGFTLQGLYLILQLLLLLIHILIPMPMPMCMHIPCSLEEVQEDLMKCHSMLPLLPQLPLALRNSRTQRWPQ